MSKPLEPLKYRTRRLGKYNVSSSWHSVFKEVAFYGIAKKKGQKFARIASRRIYSPMINYLEATLLQYFLDKARDLHNE